MKKVFNIVFFILIPFIIIPLCYGFPQFPVAYWGNVYDADGNLLGDAKVIVRDNNNIEIAKCVSDKNGRYDVIIPWDDPDTDAREGIIGKERLTFFVNEANYATITPGERGDALNMDLRQGGSPAVKNELLGVDSPDAQLENIQKGSPDTSDLPSVDLLPLDSSDAVDDSGIKAKTGQENVQSPKENDEGFGLTTSQKQGSFNKYLFISIIIVVIFVILFIFIKKKKGVQS